MSEQIHLTRKERSVYFYKLLLMYAAGVLILGVILFWNARGKAVAGPEWKGRFAQREEYGRQQIEAVRIVDSMLVKMEILKRDGRQIFIKEDLQEMVKSLSRLYGDGSAYDARGLSFIHARDFMQLRVLDIIELNLAAGNVTLKEKQLLNCQAGYGAPQQPRLYPAIDD